MLARGFRADLVGVAMERPDEPAFNRPDVYATDDWRGGRARVAAGAGDRETAELALLDAPGGGEAPGP